MGEKPRDRESEIVTERARDSEVVKERERLKQRQ